MKHFLANGNYQARRDSIPNIRTSWSVIPRLVNLNALSKSFFSMNFYRLEVSQISMVCRAFSLRRNSLHPLNPITSPCIFWLRGGNVEHFTNRSPFPLQAMRSSKSQLNATPSTPISLNMTSLVVRSTTERFLFSSTMAAFLLFMLMSSRLMGTWSLQMRTGNELSKNTFKTDPFFRPTRTRSLREAPPQANRDVMALSNVHQWSSSPEKVYENSLFWFATRMLAAHRQKLEHPTFLKNFLYSLYFMLYESSSMTHT